MSDQDITTGVSPEVLAAREVWALRYGAREGLFGEAGAFALDVARALLEPIRHQHRPVPYLNRQRCCVTCWDSEGKPHLWPCPTARKVWLPDIPAPSADSRLSCARGGIL